MTPRHHDFNIEIHRHHVTTRPGILDNTPITFHAATITLLGGDTIVCQWKEPDIAAILHDLETSNAFDAGTEWHIDVMHAVDRVYLAVWHTDHPRPVRVIDIHETDYYRRLEQFRRNIEALIEGPLD